MMNPTSALYALSRRIIEMPEFFGALLHRFRQQESLSEEDLLHHLRTTRPMLTRLALCRQPNSNSPEFVAQMRQIATFTKIDVTLLMAMLRQVEAVDALSHPGNVVRLQRQDQETPSLESGLLAAARERESPKGPSKKPKESSAEDDRK
jgi:hypothetical protein